MRTVIPIFITLACILAVRADDPKDDSSSSMEDPCVDKPCGAYICQARCIASCMETGIASNMTDCMQKFCSGLSDISPCNVNDTACWKTCGFKPTLNEQPPPPPVDEVKLDSSSDSIPTSDDDPYTIRVNWPASQGATLYIAEAFPMFDQDTTPDDDVLQRGMTDATSITFQRDICGVYMIRVLAANSFGVSPPRYLVVDSWNPDLHFDENFDISTIRREGNNVNVFIDFTPPKTWHDADVQFESSQVRAYDCLGQLDNSIFLSTKQDADGYLTPFVVINDNGTSIKLSFPYTIMYSKCLFSYRIASLKTRCNNSIDLNTKGSSGAGVDFSINCLSVENSNCDSNVMPSNDNQNNTSSNEEAVPSISQESKNATVGSSEENDPFKQAAAGIEPPANNATATQDNNSPPKSIESAESGSGSDEVPAPIVIVVEPRDPNAPVCRLADFDALPAKKGSSESKEDNGMDLILTWMEETPPYSNASIPSYFLVRYGTVLRTLVVDPQPDLNNEIIQRSPTGSDSSDELTRAITIHDLIPNFLYGFQICAIYASNPDLRTLWDTAPTYTVDLCALMGGVGADQKPSGNNAANNVTDDQLIDLFVDLLNSTADDTKQNTGAQKQQQVDSNSLDTPVDNITPDSSGPGDSNTGVLEVDVPAQPQVINVDVKPIIIEDENSSLSSMHAFWFLFVIFLIIFPCVAVSLFAAKRARRHRMKKQFNQTVTYPNPEVKIPVP